jgi:hypothetical protein
MGILVSLPELYLPVYLFQTFHYLLQFLYLGTIFVPLLLNAVDKIFKPRLTVIYFPYLYRKLSHKSEKQSRQVKFSVFHI